MMNKTLISAGCALLFLTAELSAAPAALQIGVFDSLYKARESETNLQIPARGITLDAARNESESFQILLRGKDKEKVTISISPLTNAKSKDSCITTRIRHQVDLFLETTTDFANEAGWYPDALAERDTVTLQKDVTERFWITVKVPANAAPGKYSGTVLIKTTSAGVKKIPLTLQVRKVALPKIPNFQADVGIWEQFVEPAYGIKGRHNYFRFLRKHWNFLADYRLSPRQGLPLKNGKDAQGNPTLVFPDEFKNVVKEAEETGFAYFTLPGAEYQKRKPEFYQRLNRFVNSSPYLKKYGIVYYADEPWGEKQRLKIAENLKIAKQHAPDVRFMVTYYPNPAMKGLIDIWNLPMANLTPEVKEEMQKAQKRGEKTFAYHNGVLFSVDFQPAKLRFFYWRHFDYGYSGTVYWCGTHWSFRKKGEPLLDPAAFTRNDIRKYTTNGILFYPGANGLMPSIRLETIRDASEDYDYLVLATQTVKSATGKKKLQKIHSEMRRLFPKNPMKINFRNSPEKLRTMRRELAELIEAEMK